MVCPKQSSTGTARRVSNPRASILCLTPERPSLGPHAPSSSFWCGTDGRAAKGSRLASARECMSSYRIQDVRSRKGGSVSVASRRGWSESGDKIEQWEQLVVRFRHPGSASEIDKCGREGCGLGADYCGQRRSLHMAMRAMQAIIVYGELSWCMNDSDSVANEN